MTEEPSLLRQPRIDRTPKLKRATSKLLWAVPAVLLIPAIVVGIWWWQQSQSGPLVHIAYSRALIIAGSAAPEASILDASGYVVPYRQATVASQTAGGVISLLVQEGDQVLAGEELARLDDRDQQAARLQAVAGIVQAQAVLAQANAALSDAIPIFQRSNAEFSRGLSSADAFNVARADYDTARTNVAVRQAGLTDAQANLAAANTALSETVINSPFTGVVTATNVQIGEMISSFGTGSFTRSGIVTLVDMTSLEAHVDVSEI